MQSYTILLIGGHGTGKTSFLERHKTGDFKKEYVPTLILGSTSLKFHTSLGLLNFEVFDCPVDDQKYLEQKCDAVISFYTNESHDQTQKLLDAYIKIHPDVLVVTVWGLCDKNDPPFDKGHKYLTKDKQTYQVSGKSLYNYGKPFQHIMRSLSGDKTATFVFKNIETLTDIFCQN